MDQAWTLPSGSTHLTGAELGGGGRLNLDIVGEIYWCHGRETATELWDF